MPSLIRKLAAVSFTALLVLINCCGYSTRSLLPAHLKNVAIDIFENRTIKIGMGEDMTREMVRQFTADGTLRVTGEGKAQLKITGEVSNFNKEPYVYGGDQTVYRYKITVTAKVRCFDVAKNAVYWEGEVSDWALLDQNQEENVGISAAMTKVAKETVRRLLTNW